MGEAIMGFVFIPLLHSWLATIIFDVILLGSFVIGLSLFIRAHHNTDGKPLDWIRRGIIALITVIMSLGPTVLVSNSTQATNGTDVFFAVDITGSMAVKDATYGSDTKITRINAAKDAIKGLMSMYSGANFAAVSFGASADLAVPPTSDVSAMNNWLNDLQVEPTAVSNGTLLSEPVNTLLTAMQTVHKEHPNNIIVLYYISDGNETSKQTLQSFSSLRQFVDAGAALGVGSTDGGKIPYVTATMMNSSDYGTNWIVDPTTHKDAISKEDPKALEQIADQFGGTSLMLSSTSTVKKLSADTSHTYLVRQTKRKHMQRNIAVWPYAIVLVILCLWELGVDLYRQRRFQ